MEEEEEEEGEHTRAGRKEWRGQRRGHVGRKGGREEGRDGGDDAPLIALQKIRHLVHAQPLDELRRREREGPRLAARVRLVDVEEIVPVLLVDRHNEQVARVARNARRHQGVIANVTDAARLAAEPIAVVRRRVAHEDEDLRVAAHAQAQLRAKHEHRLRGEELGLGRFVVELADLAQLRLGHVKVLDEGRVRLVHADAHVARR